MPRFASSACMRRGPEDGRSCTAVPGRRHQHHLRARCFFASACWLWTAVSIWLMKVAQREKNSSALSLASSAKYFLAASISDCISPVTRCSSSTWSGLGLGLGLGLG